MDCDTGCERAATAGVVGMAIMQDRAAAADSAATKGREAGAKTVQASDAAADGDECSTAASCASCCSN